MRGDSGAGDADDGVGGRAVSHIRNGTSGDGVSANARGRGGSVVADGFHPAVDHRSRGGNARHGPSRTAVDVLNSAGGDGQAIDTGGAGSRHVENRTLIY